VIELGSNDYSFDYADAFADPVYDNDSVQSGSGSGKNDSYRGNLKRQTSGSGDLP